jgi:DNA polymerase-1
MNTSEPMLLVDGNNLLMRALFAGKKTGMSQDGILTGPLLIFINTLAKHIREEHPSRVAIAWDGGKSAKRVALDREYKGTREFAPNLHEFRESVFSLAHEFCTLAGVYQHTVNGVEADDLIAAWWAGYDPAQESDLSITILSSDKDFLQLIGLSPHDVPTSVVRLSSGGAGTDRWTEERMREEYGFTPTDWPLVTALTGDVVDHVPGVPGVGPKTAAKILKESNGDLEAVLAHPRLSGHAEQIRMSLALVDLRTPFLTLDPPPPWRPTRPTDIVWSQLIGFLDLYGLASVKQRTIGDTLWSQPVASMSSTLGRPLRSR